MIFYIIIALLWGVTIPGLAILVYHRNTPIVATRDLSLTIIEFFALIIAHTLCLISYELLFSDIEAFQRSCVYLITCPMGITNSLCFVSALFFFFFFSCSFLTFLFLLFYFFLLFLTFVLLLFLLLLCFPSFFVSLFFAEPSMYNSSII